ncbi:MAG: FGGY-family carbohydrate kinase [Lachnospiraceae bacterium]|nr:FGGY-family carbohydrate kinase [Lachnospiraceae bacterium]
MDNKIILAEGKAVLGIEFGSTRIKAVVIDANGKVLAQGGHGWENRYENGVWTYSEEDIRNGLRSCYSDLTANVKKEYGIEITGFATIGISAMMHGYLAFDAAGNLLAPFRTWRNTITEDAASVLTKAFDFNIPQRWSIAHLYQAMRNGEAHVSQISHFTTLAGWVHEWLTGEKVLGVGDASGMFPIDSSTGNYDARMLDIFDELPEAKKVSWKLRDILPKVLSAGEAAGVLTEEGAKLLDPSGKLKAGIPLCPPEGDAGTGMVATNSVGLRTGNISAGTSVFAMVVLEKPLSKVYPEIDLVTTPDGAAVAMVHCNNCTSDINAWVNLFGEFGKLMGYDIPMGDLFTKLYSCALSGEPDCGGLLSYNFLSGEPVVGVADSKLAVLRTAESRFTLPNFMRMHMYSALGALKVGLDLLLKKEGVKVDKMLGHGGYFKTPVVGQRFAAAAVGAPVSVMETAGEGGAWGIGILAAYMLARSDGAGTLQEYLDGVIFADIKAVSLAPDAEDAAGFEKFMTAFRNGLER